MPKARRGGHQFYVRSLYYKFKYAPVTETDSEFLGTERNFIDTEYEAFFDPLFQSNRAKPLRKDIRVKSIEYIRWPRKLVNIRNNPSLPPLDYVPEDPRRTRYLQIRAEILHAEYGASTPEHWGSADQPIVLD